MDVELKNLLTTLVSKVDTIYTEHGERLSRMETSIAALQAAQAELQAGQAELKAGQAEHTDRLSRIETDVAVLKAGQDLILKHLDVAELKGRVEEQSRTLSALIPTRVAAIPGR